ncbi:hypothetical protein DBR32_08190 [Taibaiella sp. KBW10]|uniref:class I SAM-dependent methyltransferase n=1 Tax=Taibaiella sp. KBW10 TaxID=2153357 RepID=UPI000F5B394B|nr:class I SAM-dependent methyltransferase [Taibaiella sp. KBW10]RQO30700.1 hypothetical protein DBR32_08190 [Taibaiella sp. KBW10]
MENTITNPAIISFLKEKYQSTGFIDGLKIRYRSLICPFVELLAEVKPGEKVGDIGCGSGQFLLLVSRFTKAGKVFGIEIEPRLIANARNLFSTYPEEKYVFDTYDGMHFPQALSEMDVIFLIDVLHHVPKALQEAFIKNIAGLLKPGARLILKDINAASPLVYANKLHDLVFAGEIGNELSMNNAKALLVQSGLNVVLEQKRTMYVYPHYTLIAVK